MLRSIVSFLVGGILLQMAIARPEVVVSDSNLTSSVVRSYISLETSCTSDSLLILSSLNEPFFGSVYAKGFSDTAHCVALGTGGKLLRLAVNATECGVRIVELEGGKRQFELAIYVQFDHHVQQVVDEQMDVKCVLESGPQPEGNSTMVNSSQEESATKPKAGTSAPALVTSISRETAQQLNKNARLANPTINHSAQARPKPFGLSSSFQVKKVNLTRGHPSRIGANTTNASTGTSTTEESTLRKHQQLEQQEPVSCWLDIVAGKDPSQGAVKDFLYVGQDATLLVKVRQAAGFDTRLTDCLAHDGSYDSVRELVNSDGCSVDSNVLTHVQEKYSPQTGVKLIYTSFQAFKFRGKENLHIKCSVTVCEGRCPARSCLVTKRRGRDFKPEVQGTGQVRPLSVYELEDSNRIRPVARLRNNDRVLSDGIAAGYRAVDDMRKISQSRNSSSLNYGVVVDRVDIFNSIEIRVPTMDESRTTSEYILSTESTSQLTSDALFCVTPSKLFLAFGVLVGVLVVAMLLAICFCIKAKAQRFKRGQKLKYGTNSSVTQSGRTTPNPLANLRTCNFPGAYNPSVNSSNNNSGHRLPRGYVVSRSSSNPYMGMYQ